MHRNSFIISSFLAVFSFFFLAASSSAAKITESVSINTLNTTTDAASLSEQTVFSTHPPTVNAKKPHIGAITPNLPESVTGHVLYLIHHDRVIDRICHYDASGFTVTPKSGGYPTKVVDGRTYELRPSNGSTGPNRWHRVKPATTAGSQNHHLVSNPIVDALEDAGISRETALSLRNNPALQKMSAPGRHVGYENWHRAYDRHMQDWIRSRGGNLKITEFFDEINRYYQSGEGTTRIPGVSLGAPQ